VVRPFFIYKKAEFTSEKDPVAANLLYEKYIELVPFGINRAKALYTIGNNLITNDNLVDLISFSSMSSGGNSIPPTKEGVELGKKYFTELIENYQDTTYASRSYKKLLDLNIAQCNIKAVDELVSKGLNSKNQDIKKLALKYEILNLIVRKDYDSAEQKCLSYIETSSNDSDIYRMLSDIYSFKGDYKESKKLINKEQHESDETTNFIYPVLFEEPKSYSYLKNKSIDFAENFYNGTSSIKGRVTNNNEGIPYVIVILKDSRKDDVNGWSFTIQQNFIYTDANGNYEFNNLPKGEYSIEIRVPSMYFLKNEVDINTSDFKYGWINLNSNETKNQNITFNPVIELVAPKSLVEPIDDKVNVKWKPYEQVSYYKIEIINFDNSILLSGSRSQVVVSDKIYAPEYTIKMNEINQIGNAFSINEDGIISPGAFLGYSCPGSMLPIVISAYNSQDEKISTSVPLVTDFKNIPTIRINDDNLLNADKLVLEGKVKEATIEYEKYLEENPDDIRVLTVLMKIYKIGYKVDYDKDIHIGQDKDKMIVKAEKLYKLTKNPEILTFVYNGIHRMLNETEDFVWAENKINELPEEIKDASICDTLANIQINLGDLEKANEYYNMARKKDHFYVSDSNIMIKLYLKKYHEALEVTSLEDYELYNGNKEKFQEALIKIKEKDSNGNLSKKDKDTFSNIIKLFLDNNMYKADENIINEYYDLKETIVDEDFLKLLKEYERMLYIEKESD
jgi:tetratricopeptide (TPR) repeat protein